MKNARLTLALAALLLACLAVPPPVHAAGVCAYQTAQVANPNTTQRKHNADNLDALCDSLIAGVGAKNGTGVAVTESGSAAMHRSVFTLTAASVTVTDTGGANGAQGALKIYVFPAGAIIRNGCSWNLTTLAGAGGIVDGAALVGSLGTTAAAAGNATLTTTEADWIASTTGTLTSGAGTLAGSGDPVLASLDGHTTAVDLYLNLAVPDADVSASDTVAVSGTITCLWSSSGDW